MKQEQAIQPVLDQKYGGIVTGWNSMLKSQLEDRPILFEVEKLPPPWQQFLIGGNIDLVDATIVNYVRIAWDSKFKHPLPYGYLKKTKYYGEFIDAAMNLIVQCSVYCDAYELKSRPWNFLSELIDFFRFWGLCSSTLKVYELPPNNGSSREAFDRLLKVCSRVQSHELPSGELNNALRALICISMQISESKNQFRKRYFVPFIRAWRAALEEMKTHCEVFEVYEDGSLFLRKGQGKARLSIEPPRLTITELEE